MFAAKPFLSSVFLIGTIEPRVLYTVRDAGYSCVPD